MLRLGSADGSQLWRVELDGSAQGNEGLYYPAIAPDGNVVVAGKIENSGSGGDMSVLKLSSTSGAILWQQTLVGTTPGEEVVMDVMVDASGDVVVAGYTTNLGTYTDFTVVKLSGVDGAEMWRRVVSSASRTGTPTFGMARAVAPTANGDVAVAGRFGRLFVMARINADGTPSRTVQPVDGKRLLLKDRAGDAAARKLVLMAKDRNSLIPPTPGGPGDPSMQGADLLVYNPASGETMTIPLPFDRWVVKGFKPSNFRYTFSDRTGTCRKVKLRPGLLKASCRGADIDFSLDEPAQGALAVRMQAGSDDGGIAYCMVFGGLVARDRPKTMQ